MKSDIELQLRDYWQQVDAEVPDLVPFEVLQQPRVAPLQPTRWRLNWRPVWVTGFAALVVVLALGAVGLVVGSGGDSVPPIDQPAETLGPVSSLADLGEGWVRALSDVSTAEVADVAVGGPGFVAVGRANMVGAVWTSTDGMSWTAQSLTDLGLEGGSMFSVVRGGPGFVAVGSWNGVAVEGLGVLEEAEFGIAAVWTSIDGLDWTRVAHDAVFETEGSNLVMWDVTLGGPGLVAVGAEEGSEAIRPAVWTSSDGTTWSRVLPDTPALESGAMDSVISGGPGFIAWGSDVWISEDAVTWARASVPDGLTDGLADIAVGGPGVVAVGGTLQPGKDGFGTAVWTSADGLSWEGEPGGTGFEGGMDAVVDVGAGLLATGGISTAANDFGSVAVAWISVDGVDWLQLPEGLVDAGYISQVVVGDSAVIALTDEGIWVWGVASPSETDAPTATLAPIRLPAGRIAYVNAASRVVVSDQDGSTIATMPVVSGARVAAPTWSPDGTELTFSACPQAAEDHDRCDELYVVAADGSDLTLLADQAGLGSWSPDGTRIAFSSHQSGSAQVYVINSDGSGLAQLTGPTSSAQYPVWSPDGTRILFQSGGGIFVMEPDGTGVELVTPVGGSPAKWSPDGNRIVFRGLNENSGRLFVIGVDGSGLAPLSDDEVIVDEFAWSLDGSRIAFMQYRDEETLEGEFSGAYQIWVINADGSELTKLTDSSRGARNPNWSPDGTYLAFETVDDSPIRIFLIATDHSGDLHLFKTEAVNPAWAPTP